MPEDGSGVLQEMESIRWAKINLVDRKMRGPRPSVAWPLGGVSIRSGRRSAIYRPGAVGKPQCAGSVGWANHGCLRMGDTGCRAIKREEDEAPKLAGPPAYRPLPKDDDSPR